MNLWVQKQGCGPAAQPEPAAAPLSRTTSTDPARAPPYCSHQGETQHTERGGGERGDHYDLNTVSSRVILRQRCLFLSAHLNSTALKNFISVVLAPHTMCPIATSVLESSWLGLCSRFVEFNTVVNSADS